MPPSNVTLSKSRGSYMGKHDACEAELEKKTKYLNKWQSISERNLGNEENQMRKQLERLQRDKLTYSQNEQDLSAFDGENTRSFHDIDHDGQSGTFKYDQRYARRVKARLQKYEQSHARSRRQLKIDFPTPAPTGSQDSKGKRKQSREKTPKLPEIPGVPKPAKIHTEKSKKRRHTLPAGYSSGHPAIVVTENDEQNNESLPAISSHHMRDVKSPDNVHHHGRKMSGHDVTGSENDEQLSNLYEMAIQTVASTDESVFVAPVQDVRRRGSFLKMKDDKMPDTRQMDLNALKELEVLLKEARHFNTKRQRESDYGLHTATSRGQQRRLQFLEEILQAMSETKDVKFDPEEMLNCGYLRLSKSNVETLENMLRDAGINPGIHAHSDVTNYNLWDDIHQEQEQELKKSGSVQKTSSRARVHLASPKKRS